MHTTYQISRIINNFESSDIGTYTCVGRNMFNNKGDREEADINVDFIESKHYFFTKI